MPICVFVHLDWNATDYQGTIPFPPEDRKLALPLVFQFLTPMPVAMIGLGAVSAAVMSSCDSCILSAASMFARNVHASIRQELYNRKITKTKVSYLFVFFVNLHTTTTTTFLHNLKLCGLNDCFSLKNVSLVLFDVNLQQLY